MLSCRYVDEMQPADTTASGGLHAERKPQAGHHTAADCAVSRLADVTEEQNSSALQEASPGTITLKGSLLPDSDMECGVTSTLARQQCLLRPCTLAPWLATVLAICAFLT